jgi:hypothetical protein
VDLQAVPRGIDVAQRRELARAVARRLPVVPGDDDGFVDVSLLHRFGKTIVVQELGVAVATQKQVAGKAGPEADRIDPEIRQVGETDPKGHPDVIEAAADAVTLLEEIVILQKTPKKDEKK